jgi:hypothetical protein
VAVRSDLIDFQPAQGQVVAPDASLEAAGVAGRATPIDLLRLPQFPRATRPQCGMVLFRKGHTLERLFAPASGSRSTSAR